MKEKTKYTHRGSFFIVYYNLYVIDAYDLSQLGVWFVLFWLKYLIIKSLRPSDAYMRQ